MPAILSQVVATNLFSLLSFYKQKSNPCISNLDEQQNTVPGSQFLPQDDKGYRCFIHYSWIFVAIYRPFLTWIKSDPWPKDNLSLCYSGAYCHSSWMWAIGRTAWWIDHAAFPVHPVLGYDNLPYFLVFGPVVVAPVLRWHFGYTYRILNSSMYVDCITKHGLGWDFAFQPWQLIALELDCNHWVLWGPTGMTTGSRQCFLEPRVLTACCIYICIAWLHVNGW